jgi:hypothetical protein
MQMRYQKRSFYGVPGGDSDRSAAVIYVQKTSQIWTRLLPPVQITIGRFVNMRPKLMVGRHRKLIDRSELEKYFQSFD